MARRPAFLIRMLVSLVLLIAALPARTSVPPCAKPPISVPLHAAATCAMPCCAVKKVAMNCCPKTAVAPKTAASHLAESCACELKAPAEMPVTVSKAAPTAFGGGLILALAPEPPLVAGSSLRQAEPGIFGSDSGPPSDSPYRLRSSRAPPVVRA